ncbi:MAG: hypothetical protein KBT04_02740, partial [Bacteroidales bacterium]|nr:hypothetical protein [Candidatus Colimorpha onthohippi]
ILGKGRNSCYYDGSDTVSCPPSLGYLLGDEGSGNHIGRCLIKDFFSGCMPAELASVFSCQYHISHDAVLDALYHQPQPNRYLASLASFAIQYSSTPYIQTLLANVFNAYFQHQVALLSTLTRQLALVGGIAHQFAAQIEACANQNGYSIVQIRKALIEPPIKK